MSWTSGLRKLRTRTPRERLLLLEAVVALAIARVGVASLRFQRTAVLLRLAPGEPMTAPTPSQVAQAEPVGWAVRAVAARLPWRSTCLIQALAAKALLQQRGLPGSLCLGVAKDAESEEGIAAHAWVRCGDSVLVGEAGHDRFAAIASYS